jgi:hypothetical protein
MQRAAASLFLRAAMPARARGASTDHTSTTATSLAAALAAKRGTITTLDLAGPAYDDDDLTCVNLMCEKVGQPCVCRLAGALDKLAGRGVVEVRVREDIGGVLLGGQGGGGGVVPAGMRVVVVVDQESSGVKRL